MDEETKTIIGQLDQARALGLGNKDVFPQVVKQILNLVGNPNVAVQLWCARFLKEAFTASSTLAPTATKVDLALDALPALKVLAAVRDLDVFKAAVDVAVVVFKLTFRYVAENDGSHGAWAGVNDLKNNLVAKYDTQFPFDSSFDREHDSFRNVDCKLELLKFVMTVVDYQSRSASNKSFSLARVPPGHTLIKPPLMESEASALVDVVLRTLQNDILVAPLATATLNHLSVLVRRKRQFLDRVLPVLDAFDSTAKLQSNYESLECFKLSRKYVDRTLRILLNYMTKLQLVPPKYQSAVARKLQILTARGDEIRKKNIIQPADSDSAIRKRKFEGFHNPAKKYKGADYKALYTLADASSELNNFDLSAIPQHILVTMALAALKRAPVPKLTKALEIISARFTDAVSSMAPAAAAVKSEPGAKEDDDDDDDDDKKNYDPETEYTLPPPKLLSFQEKKDHVNLIVKNFFELANKSSGAEDDSPAVQPEGSVSKELTRVAIDSWKQDSWLVLLTRLAARGMYAVDSKAGDSADAKNNEQLSDLIRKALFDYFLANIHERIDLVIEWLNEEWYSEKVKNEQDLEDEVRSKWQAKYEEDPNSVADVADEVRKEMDAAVIETPVYNKWGRQVLDALIPFLEPTDRRIFLRLLSDVPALTREMVAGIKSLCSDPARSKLGFLSLQFLIMYRPPAKAYCFDVLRDLTNGDQEDLKEEAQKLLAKYEQ